MAQSPLKMLSVAAIAGLCIAVSTAPIAEASPRFSVTNNADAKINVYIYTGDDSVCTWEEKLKSVSKGETDSYGCTGNGKASVRSGSTPMATKSAKALATPAWTTRSKLKAENPSPSQKTAKNIPARCLSAGLHRRQICS